MDGKLKQHKSPVQVVNQKNKIIKETCKNLEAQNRLVMISKQKLNKVQN